jgi:hypothetical protein
MYRFCAFRRRQAGAHFVSSSSSCSLSYPGAFERLEDRRLMSGTFRTIDGTGNNLTNPDWGSVGEQLLRRAAAAYADGVSSPAGADRPSAREVSNVVAAAVEDGTINDRNLTAFTYVWGQFLDHDLDLTGGAAVREAFNVAVPLGDPMFDPLGTGTAVIPLNRSEYDPTTGTSMANPRQQVNSITAWIDGSVVYGSDDARAAALRTFVGGRLKTSEGNLLPLNTAGLPNANDAHLFPDSELFLAGDVRANENIELTSVQVLFMREHNRVAAQLQARNPRWTDERIYQEARQIVSSEIQERRRQHVDQRQRALQLRRVGAGDVHGERGDAGRLAADDPGAAAGLEHARDDRVGDGRRVHAVGYDDDGVAPPLQFERRDGARFAGVVHRRPRPGRCARTHITQAYFREALRGDADHTVRFFKFLGRVSRPFGTNSLSDVWSPRGGRYRQVRPSVFILPTRRGCEVIENTWRSCAPAPGSRPGFLSTRLCTKRRRVASRSRQPRRGVGV